MTETVESDIIAIIAEQALLDVSEVSLDSTPEELGLESLGIVETIFAIEEKFDIQIPFNANNPDESEFDISSVKAIIDAVRGLISAQKY